MIHGHKQWAAHIDVQHKRSSITFTSSTLAVLPDLLQLACYVASSRTAVSTLCSDRPRPY